ncbi:phosphoribosylglycinamide formyltransferase-1 [Bacilli bacterium PM5-3]|nr:phosphoribosylglycinamide formyltransferase-1 [Bacilli bacterium PM5-3]MDH6603282.1 phosphoribosylglycinamide formyltransferase-1 [Bacilli bacterium PM5-9]
MLKNVAVFASGNGSNFQAIIDAMNNKELAISIKILVCNNDDAYAINRAIENDIDVILIDYKKYSSYEIESMLVAKLKELKIDYILLAGFMRKLTPLFISSYRNRIINIHPSLLPKYKGLHAIEQALDNGDNEIGVSVHFVDEKLDNGPIIIQDSVDIKGLSSDDMYEKIHKLEHVLYVKAIKKVLEEA